MSNTTPDARRLGRTDKPFSSVQHRSAGFARAAVFAEFGRNAWAIDEIDFVDRLPNQAARRVDGHLARGAA